jgi:TPR repeat protein
MALPIVPDYPETRAEVLAAPHSNFKYWLFGILALGLLGGSLGYYLLYPSGESPSAFQSKVDVPPVLRPYLERANQGDPTAMYMLGTMYYNGLNVPQNHKEGIRWYRKAAAAGNVAARMDLTQIGLNPDGK